MTMLMLFLAVVFVCCALSNKLSTKFGFPALLIFMVLGMLFGADGILKIDFNDFNLSNNVCTVALLFIIFYGGFGTNWETAKTITKPAVVLSTLGVALTAMLTGLFCYFVLRIELLESLLIGAVISSTDAASVFYILRSRKLNLKNGLAPLLEVESGSNDPMSYTITIIILTLIDASAQGGAFSIKNTLLLIASQFTFGAIIGAAIGIGAAFIMRKVVFDGNGIQTIFVVAAALASYSLSSLLNGNGFLSVYITGIILGNTRFAFKTGLVHFFDGITWMMQILLFFILGLLAYPSQIPAILGTAILVTLFLTFIARPAAIMALLSFFHFPLKDMLLVSWAGLRGGASIAFAIMAVVSSSYTKFDLFHIVFCVSLLSVAFQGTLLPIIAKKLKLVDSSESVLKTFNDYQDPSAMQLINVYITEKHPWATKKLMDITLPANSLAVLIKRHGEYIRPRGNSVVQKGDTLVLNTVGYQNTTDLRLTEERISLRHAWNGKQLKDITIPQNEIVVMIRRGDEKHIPHGASLFHYGDIAVIGHIPEKRK